MESFDLSLDDFDWSTPVTDPPASGPTTPGAAPPEELTPPAPDPTPIVPSQARRGGSKYDIDESLLPKAYREYKGNQYKRKRAAPLPEMSTDDFDWGSGTVTAAPAPASDDWAVTRGVKEAYTSGQEAIYTLADMQRIAALPTEAEQRAAMLELGKKQAAAPSTLQEPEIQGIGGVGEFFTWLGESAGQMIGSMGAAVVTGGGAGAAAGAGVGGVAGATAGGIGAIPGALAGGAAGAGYGTMAAFGGMGIGGMYNDLLQDPGVQEGLANGTIAPSTILASAVGAGALIGALDAVPATKLFKGLTSDVSQEVVKKGVRELAKSGLKGGATTALEEGVTEAGQGAISELGQAIIGGNADVFERSMSVINQGLAGAVGGFGPGAAGGAVTQIRRPGEANPAAPAGEDSPIPPADPPNPAQPGQRPAPPIGPARRPGENYGKQDEQTVAPSNGLSVLAEGDVASDLAAATAAEGAPAPAEPEEEAFDVEDEGEFAARAPAGIRLPGVTVVSTPSEAPDLAAALKVEQPAAAEAVEAASAGAAALGDQPTPAPAPAAGEPLPEMNATSPAAAPVLEEPPPIEQPAAPVEEIAAPAEEPLPLQEDLATIPEPPSGIVAQPEPVPVTIVEEAPLELVEAPAKPVRKLSKKAQEARAAGIRNFATTVSRVLEAADQARGELDLAPSPDEFEVETEPVTYKGKKPPSRRQAKLRAKAQAEHAKAVAAHKKAKEAYAAAAPLARTTLADAVKKYNQLEGDERADFVDRLSEAASEQLRQALATQPKAAPAPQAKPPAAKKPAPAAKKPAPEKRAPRGAAVLVKPAAEEPVASFAAPTEKVSVSATIDMLRKLGSTEAIVNRLRTAKITNKETGKAARATGVIKQAPSRKVRPIGAKKAVTMAGEAWPEGRIKIGGEALTPEALLDKYTVTMATTRERVESAIPAKKTARDRAIDALLKHFGRSTKLAKLSKLFTADEIAALEAAGLAEDGAMDLSEFKRWYQSVKGAAVPEGIGPKDSGPRVAKNYKLLTWKRDKTPAEVGYERFLARQKEKENAPYVREVPKGSPTAAEKQIGTATQATAAVLATQQGMVGARGKGEVPVTARSAVAEPTATVIPKKGDRYKRGKVKVSEHYGQLQQEVEQQLPAALKEAGVLSDLSQTQIEEAAAKAAKAQSAAIIKARLAPLQAARERITAALKEAVALYKGVSEADRERFRKHQRMLEAEQQKLWAAEDSATKSRASPVTGQKKSVAMKAEDERRTREIARAEREKDTDRQNPLLLEIANIWDLIVPKRQKPEFKEAIAGWKRRIANLQAQRIANQEALERAEAEADRIYEERKIEEAASLQADLRELEIAGVSEADIEQYQFNREVAQQYKTRNTRAVRSTPIIQKTLADHPRPVPAGTRIQDERAFIQDLDTWAKKFVAAGEAALKAAGITLNERVSRIHNTPDENVLIYIKNLLADRQEQEDRLARKGKVFSSKQLIHRGQGMFEAWSAVQLIEPLDANLTSAQRRLQSHQNEQLLNGMITDATKTESARSDPYGLQAVKQAQREDEAARFLRPATNLEEIAVQRQHEGPLADALRRALRSKGYGAKKVDLDELPLGKDAETTTAAQAIDKYMRGWKKRGGLSGWQNMMRRALMKSLKALVGHTPVHFVDASVIASFEGMGGRPAAFIHQADGKSFILLNHNLKGRPKLLDELLLHELTHAATAHAIDNNLRGTRDAIRALMTSLRKTLADGQLTENEAYAFENEHEFLAQAMNNAEVQQLMASLNVPLATRAKIRALGKGRAMPTYWDVMVAAVERAIGLFTSGRAGTSYIDSVLRVYPHAAMSSAEQMADAAIRLKTTDIKDLTLGSPFDMSATMSKVSSAFYDRSLDWRTNLQRAGNKIIMPTETIRRRVAERYFGGDMTNPFSDLVNELEELQRRVEDGMRPGDQMDDDLRRWMMIDSDTRRAILAEVHDLVVNASIDGIDPRKTLKENYWIRNDADHPTKKKRTKPSHKHVRDTEKRTLHGKYAARWDALPAELKPMISKRLDLMKTQMQEYETKMVTRMLDRLWDAPSGKYNLPPGTSRSDAVKEVMSGKMSEELKTALGDNAKTIGAMGKFGARDQMYAPASRMGRYFISGRRNIATPKTTHGQVLFDQEAMDGQGTFRFIFNNLQDAVDYTNKMAASGDERVLKFQRKYINPLNGDFVPSDEVIDPGGGKPLVQAQPIYYVTMQDRFMAMSDSQSELLAQRKELIASGEYLEEDVAKPSLLKEHRSLATSMPLSLQSMINNINSQTAVDAADKAVAIEMITNHFIRTQQGNRITKKLIRRTGTLGFETGSDEMFRAFHTNNEMMTRHIVALDRWPAIAEAEKKLDTFNDALRTRRPADLIKLPLRERALIKQGYGKRDDTASVSLGEDISAIKQRIAATMNPTKLPFGENTLNAVQSLTTLNYLAKPIYYAIQTLGLPLQTFPNMAAQMSKLDGYGGITRAMRYLQKGMADVGVASSVWRGVTEGIIEGKEALGGLKPRKNWMEARPVRRAHDFVEDLKGKLRRNNAKYAEVKIRALEKARLRNRIGQAGLDQPNLRLDLQQKSKTSKFFRSIERSTRIFRALQEGLELVNRAAPICGYVEYYLDKGMSEEQAIELAINNMAKEQTDYSKANWPAWLGNPVFGTMFMFKKFAAQQAISFYGSLRQAFDGSDKADQRAAIIHIATMTVALALIGGFVGNPLWEPMRYLMYLLQGLGIVGPGNWDETKTQGEAWLAGLTGDTIAEVAMYGLPRLAGFDLSNRVALDSLLFYEQPEEMEQDEWYKIVGQMVFGATGSMGMDAMGSMQGLTGGDDSWPKWLSKLPAPGIVKDIFKAYDQVAHGPTTSTGVSTGDPIGLLAGLVTAAGLKTRAAARPFEQGSAAQHRAQERIATEKSTLIRRVNAGGMTGANMRAINDWNRAHPEKENRITGKSLSNARKRRIKTEREIREQNAAAQ